MSKQVFSCETELSVRAYIINLWPLHARLHVCALISELMYTSRVGVCVCVIKLFVLPVKLISRSLIMLAYFQICGAHVQQDAAVADQYGCSLDFQSAASWSLTG